MSVENNSPRADRQAEHDRVWMQAALAQAALAEAADEVPIGAVVVLEEQIIGRGHNTPIATTMTRLRTRKSKLCGTLRCI